MITLKVAVERLIAVWNILSWREPSIVRLGSLIVSRHGCATGAVNDGATAANSARTDPGAVGARSGLPVCGLSQVWIVGLPALALRNERSSSRKISRFLPQRNER